jgi:hypothetical protein
VPVPEAVVEGGAPLQLIPQWEQLLLQASSGCAGSVGPRGLPCAAGAAMLPGTATLPARRRTGRCTGGSARGLAAAPALLVLQCHLPQLQLGWRACRRILDVLELAHVTWARQLDCYWWPLVSAMSDNDFLLRDTRSAWGARMQLFRIAAIGLGHQSSGRPQQVSLPSYSAAVNLWSATYVHLNVAQQSTCGVIQTAFGCTRVRSHRAQEIQLLGLQFISVFSVAQPYYC